MEEDLGVMLAALLRRYHDAVAPGLAAVPHGSRGYQTLREVVEGSQPSQLALAGHLGIDRTVMTYLVDDLTASGLVERRANPADRRQRQVVPTDAGAAAVAELCVRVRAAEDALLEALDADERTQLRALLAKATGEVTAAEADACAAVSTAPAA